MITALRNPSWVTQAAMQEARRLSSKPTILLERNENRLIQHPVEIDQEKDLSKHKIYLAIPADLRVALIKTMGKWCRDDMEKFGLTENQMELHEQLIDELTSN
jgi:hypothetical protein